MSLSFKSVIRVGILFIKLLTLLNLDFQLFFKITNLRVSVQLNFLRCHTSRFCFSSASYWTMRFINSTIYSYNSGFSFLLLITNFVDVTRCIRGLANKSIFQCIVKSNSKLFIVGFYNIKKSLWIFGSIKLLIHLLSRVFKHTV